MVACLTEPAMKLIALPSRIELPSLLIDRMRLVL